MGQDKKEGYREIKAKNIARVYSYGIFAAVAHSLVWIGRLRHAYRLKSKAATLGFVAGQAISGTGPKVPDEYEEGVLSMSLIRLASTRPPLWPYLAMTIIGTGLLFHLSSIVWANKAKKGARVVDTLKDNSLYDFLWDIAGFSHGFMFLGAICQLLFGTAASKSGMGWPARLWILSIFLLIGNGVRNVFQGAKSSAQRVL